MLTVQNTTPPNYPLIRAAGLGGGNTVYCYGSVLYNPKKLHLPEDILAHEAVHEEQQGNDPDIWWKRYTYDRAFRLQEELQAYSRQYVWIREHVGSSAAKESLFELAKGLSSDVYRLGLSYGEAEQMIRRAVKNGA